MSDSRPHGEGVVIPAWLAKAIAVSLGSALLGGIVWAFKVNADIGSIKTSLQAAVDVKAAEMGDIKRRMDRLESLWDSRTK